MIATVDHTLMCMCVCVCVCVCACVCVCVHVYPCMHMYTRICKTYDIILEDKSKNSGSQFQNKDDNECNGILQ